MTIIKQNPASRRLPDFRNLGVMLRHFHDIRVMLEELRHTGRVTVPPEDLSVEPITRLLSGDA